MFRHTDIEKSRRFNTVVKGLITVITVAILGSFVAASCGAGAGSFSISSNNAQSCQEQSMAATTESKEPVWLAVFPDPLKQIALTVAFIAVLFATKFVVERKLPVHIIQRNRFFCWIWARSRPFISRKNFIPYFAPVHDA